MIGRIHSEETFATLDGNGIRYALFMQGCPYRCVYCHNPDTWDIYGGTAKSSQEVVNRISRYINYYKSGGGVTLSGGEPLLQYGFTQEILQGVKALGLHTALDTSGAVYPPNIDTILEYTDLVILDIKGYDDAMYRRIAGGSMENSLRLLDKLEKTEVDVWLRTVIVPQLNDKEEDIIRYAQFAKVYKCVSKYELLAYHTLGLFKYESMGVDYPLSGVNPLDKDKLASLQQTLDKHMKVNE